MPTATREVTVLNEQGFHARPAMKFADVANAFASEVRLTKRGTDGEPDEAVDGKSIMALLTLMGIEGTRYTIDADGDDADRAAEALAELFERKFDE